MVGDTSVGWLLWMCLMLLFSPFHTLAELSIATGATLKKAGMDEWLDNFCKGKDRHIVAVAGSLGLALMPPILAAFCVVYPFVVLGRIAQILENLFCKTLGHCLRKLCCCY